MGFFSAIGGLAGSLLAPDVDTGVQGKLLGANTPGYRLGLTSIKRKPEVQNLFSGLSRIPQSIESLRSEVRPGFGRLTDALVSGIRNARSESVGNLRAQLARRRVQGASFAEDAVSRQELAFGQAESEARARGFLGELQMNVELLNEEANRLQQQIRNNLEELGIASGAAQAANGLIAQANELDKRLQAQSAASYGAFGAELLGDLDGLNFGNMFRSA